MCWKLLLLFETSTTTYIKSSGFYLSIEFVLVLIPERRISNQQNIEYYTCHTHAITLHTWMIQLQLNDNQDTIHHTGASPEPPAVNTDGWGRKDIQHKILQWDVGLSCSHLCGCCNPPSESQQQDSSSNQPWPLKIHNWQVFSGTGSHEMCWKKCRKTVVVTQSETVCSS